MKRNMSIILFLMLILFQIYGSFHMVAFAEGTVELTGTIDSSTVIPIDGKVFINPMVGSFCMNYSIDNQSTEELIFVENVTNRAGAEVPGSSFRRGIQVGEKINFKGESYSAKPEDAPYKVKYQVISKESGAIIKSGEQRVDMVNDRINVIYSVDKENAFKGDSVRYTIQVNSMANVDLYNLVVKDNTIGINETIAVLKSGSNMTLSKSFAANSTFESFVTINYDDPLGIRESISQQSNRIKVKVGNEEAPVGSLEFKGSADQAYLSSKGEVNFIFQLKNVGNVILTDVQCLDWDGKLFYTLDRLAPNEEKTIQQKWEIEPEKPYTFVCRLSTAGSTERVQYQYNVKIPKLGPKVEITRNITPQKAAVGGTVTIEYSIKNIGNVTLTNLLVEEPEMGEVGNRPVLEPNEVWEFSKQRVMDQEGYSKPVLTAKIKDLDVVYENYEASKLTIPVDIPVGAPHLSIGILVTPEKLQKPGGVEVELTLNNDGGGTIKNLSAVLLERNNLNVGSALKIDPGEEVIFTIPQLGVEKTESFTIVVKGSDSENKPVEFRKSFEVRIGEAEENDGDEIDPNTQPTKPKKNLTSLLRGILLFILFLIVVVSGTLVYYIKRG